MAVIAPLRGITYNIDLVGDMSLVTAPPYDVITEEDRRRYYSLHPNNIVRLILGEKRKGDTDWDNRYTRAADFLRRWQEERILVRSERPAIYLTSHTFPWGGEGQSLTRWGIIALVRIEEEDSGIILPHERTFSAHKDDRLNLMRACSAHFSQIFSLYDDPSQIVLSLCKRYTESRPKFQFRFEDGSLHSMWEIYSVEAHERLQRFFLERPLYIADGHHRYETSRNFRNIMRARYGRRPGNRSYEFTLMYLCAIQDRGLKVLSSHRMIRPGRPLGHKDLLDRVSDFFHIEAATLSNLNPEQDAKALSRILAERGSEGTSFALIAPRPDNCHILKLKEGMEEYLGEDLHPCLKKLDVLVLSRLILQRGLQFTREELDDDRLIHYQSDTAKALASIQAGDYSMGFVLNPTRVEQVREVADNRLVMPRKSTFFHPKVLSGLVLNKIDPNESITVP
jgi:uncharacterized protein (DUF1015 family)